jgi:phytoene dehydrogenase-like protein
MAGRAIVVGSGINGLVCAALLAKTGRKVTVLERAAEPGGCLRTGEITAPGFVHDVMATTFVLFRVGPAQAALGKDLARHGVVFCDTPHPTAVLLPDGRAAVLSMDRAANVAMFEALAPGDGAAHAEGVARVERNAELLFHLLGQDLWTRSTALLLAKQAWRRGPRDLAAWFGEALEPARGWLEGAFASEVSRALLAPWVLHTGLGPDSAASAEMARVIAFTLEAAGAPIVKGGAARLVQALCAIVAEHGGEVRCNAEVARILVRGGEAKGVRLTSGEEIAGGHVVASVTPAQLYGTLLDKPPKPAAAAAARWRHGKGNFQLHYALDRPPAWRSPGLEQVALIHLTPGLDGVSKAVNEAERGVLPAVPTICVGQPTALDPTRAPAGNAVLWLQMPEAPRAPKGDAAGTIPCAGTWTEALREAFADRVESILAAHVDGFRDSVIARRALSPADLEAMNVNLVGGDPYGGACALDQSFLWRPLKGGTGPRTGVRNLWHIGASTHPGPGLGGGSGVLAARAIR